MPSPPVHVLRQLQMLQGTLDLPFCPPRPPPNSAPAPHAAELGAVACAWGHCFLPQMLVPCQALSGLHCPSQLLPRELGSPSPHRTPPTQPHTAPHCPERRQLRKASWFIEEMHGNHNPADAAAPHPSSWVSSPATSHSRAGQAAHAHRQAWALSPSLVCLQDLQLSQAGGVCWAAGMGVQCTGGCSLQAAREQDPQVGHGGLGGRDWRIKARGWG